MLVVLKRVLPSVPEEKFSTALKKFRKLITEEEFRSFPRVMSLVYLFYGLLQNSTNKEGFEERKQFYQDRSNKLDAFINIQRDIIGELNSAKLVLERRFKTVQLWEKVHGEQL